MFFLRCTSTVTHSGVLRSNDSADNINSDLSTVALAHTGCTQALWREVGVRNGGCEVIYMCHRSATAASKSFQGRSKRSRLIQDMSWQVPETGDFVPCPGYALFGSLMRKRNRLLRSQLSHHRLQGRDNLHAPQLRFYFSAMHALSHVVPVHRQSTNCSSHAHFKAFTALRHFSF